MEYWVTTRDIATATLPPTWARPDGDLPFCAVREIEGGGVVTYCAGRWATSDTHELHHAPELEQCCRRCLAETSSTETVRVSDDVFGATTVLEQLLAREWQVVPTVVINPRRAPADAADEDEWGGEG
jgi:hypothetical protein